MKALKRVGMALVIIGVAMQVVRPARTNPPVDERRTLQASTRVPAEVGAILERSCNDCHSSTTRWPWYSNVAPVSWYLARHVNDGRKELSFSEWGGYSQRRVARKLLEVCEQLEKGGMPVWSYALVYPSAKLSEGDKQTLCGWARQERARVQAGQTQSSP